MDNNATTQPLPQVVGAMGVCLESGYANPSSVHHFGQRVRHEVEVAREKVATLIGARPRELVFTSGGTESINLALCGFLRARRSRVHRPMRVVTSMVEHSAVLKVCERLEKDGCEIVRIGVDADGLLDLAEFETALSEDTDLVSLMYANNETGVLFDMQRLAELCAERGVALHVDAVQAVAKVPIDVRTLPVTMLSLSAHKFHGPKGVGALFVRRRTPVEPLILGGGQERDMRGGTENVAGIVGLGVAAEEVGLHLSAGIETVRDLRDRLERGILERFPTARVNGGGATRIANTTNIGFDGLEAEAILILLSEAGICASAGSACSSGSLEPSHVLKAMNVDRRIAHGSIRFSLSRFNTDEEIDGVVRELPKLLGRLDAFNRERN